MRLVREALEKVTKTHYFNRQGTRSELVSDAEYEDEAAFYYYFPGKEKDKRLVFSAHLDTVFGKDARFFVKHDEYHGTMDNAAGVTLLLCLKDDLKHGRVFPKNSIEIIFTKQEELNDKHKPFESAYIIAERISKPSLITVVDVRPSYFLGKDVVIENLHLPKAVEVAEAVAGNVAAVRRIAQADDEAVAYTQHFMNDFPTLSIGPVIFSRSIPKEKVETTWWHDISIDTFVRGQSMLDAYGILKKIVGMNF